MKIRKSDLRQIIREEAEKINESRVPKAYVKYLAVNKKLAELREKQVDILTKWKEAGKPKSGKIMDDLRAGSSNIKKLEKNIRQLEDRYNV